MVSPMSAGKTQVSRILVRSPRMFDLAKRLSRIAGDRSFVYDFLARFAREHPSCRFLQIGANDGLVNDPLREFVIRNRWTGICVEPVPHVFARLRKNYSRFSHVRLENSAISSEPGTMRFYATRQSSAHPEGSLLGSFDRSHLIRHGVAHADILETQVPVLTVAGVLAKHGFDGIDLLHVDAEGHEPAIFSGMDFRRVRPAAILFESRHFAGSRVPQLLESAGYAVRNIDEDSVATLA
jgi:FkbM family methyltransferase